MSMSFSSCQRPDDGRKKNAHFISLYLNDFISYVFSTIKHTYNHIKNTEILYLHWINTSFDLIFYCMHIEKKAAGGEDMMKVSRE